MTPMSHPNWERLTAFGHGKLDETAAREVVDHLASCEACREFLDNLPDDDLLALIRPLFTPKPQRSPHRPCLGKPLERNAEFLGHGTIS